MKSELKPSRHLLSLTLRVIVVASAVITVSVCGLIVLYILIKGLPNLKPQLFEWQYNSENVSMMPAIINTLLITLFSLVIAVPLGIFAAIYLAEYAGRGNRLVKVIRLMTETLAGIPSIVYGLFGYLVFNIACGLSHSLLGGALTLSIMILPLIMRTTEESLRSVPDSYREGSYGLGAGRLRTIFKLVLPAAIPGILSGVILSIGRIVGETAALIYTAGTLPEVAGSLLSSGRTLSVHMYALISEGLYMDEAYGAAVVLLVLVLAINTLSGVIARRISK